MPVKLVCHNDRVMCEFPIGSIETGSVGIFDVYPRIWNLHLNVLTDRIGEVEHLQFIFRPEGFVPECVFEINGVKFTPEEFDRFLKSYVPNLRKEG